MTFQQRILILFVMMFFASFASAQTSGERLAEREKAKAQEKQELKEMGKAQSIHVSLEADVARFCDWTIEKRRFVRFAYVSEHYGAEAAYSEWAKQAKARNSDELIEKCLYASGDFDLPIFHNLAAEHLHSKSEYLRAAALDWFICTPAKLTDAERAEIAGIVRQNFFESHGQQKFQTFAKYLTPKDLPQLRQLYRAHFKDQTEEVGGEPSMEIPGTPTLYPCTYALSGARNTRSRMLLWLAKLGDADAKKEILSAIEQIDDVQRRSWGVQMAGRWKDSSALPLLAKALDDTRLCPEKLDLDVDSDKPKSVVFRNIRTRICDLAVRAIHDIKPPKEQWAFPVPETSDWSVRNYATDFAFKQIGDPVFDPKTQKFYREYVVGFTDEQIQSVRDYVKTQ